MRENTVFLGGMEDWEQGLNRFPESVTVSHSLIGFPPPCLRWHTRCCLLPQPRWTKIPHTKLIMSTTIHHLSIGQEASGLRPVIEKAASGSPVSSTSLHDYLADRKDSEPGCVVVELNQADQIGDIVNLAFGTSMRCL